MYSHTTVSVFVAATSQQTQDANSIGKGIPVNLNKLATPSVLHE